VAGAIPILRPIRDSLSGDRITRVLGIVNGTTNYILDQMHSTGAQFADALRQAQDLGYAEADPTADIEGHDAAAKAAILASLSFHTRFGLENVSCEGITGVSAEDIAAAKEDGYVIKLLAIAELLRDAAGEDGVNVRVHPTLLPADHPLAAVHGAFNAVFIEAENAGQLMFYGRAPGGDPHGGRRRCSARRVSGRPPHESSAAPAPGPQRATSPQLSIDTWRHRATASGLDVADQPGGARPDSRHLRENGVVHRDHDGRASQQAAPGAEGTASCASSPTRARGLPGGHRESRWRRCPCSIQ
jgi:homoserine dehydrogenase